MRCHMSWPETLFRTSWSSRFTGWIQVVGILKLANPGAATFATGASVDKYLFVPGFSVLAAFLLPSDARLSARGEQPDVP